MFCNRTYWRLETVFSITIFSLIYFKFLKLGNYCIFFFSRCHLQKHISSVNTHQLNKLGIISSNLVRTGTWNDRNKQRAWSGLFYGYSSNGDFPPPPNNTEHGTHFLSDIQHPAINHWIKATFHMMINNNKQTEEIFSVIPLNIFEMPSNGLFHYHYKGKSKIFI